MKLTRAYEHNWEAHREVFAEMHADIGIMPLDWGRVRETWNDVLARGIPVMVLDGQPLEIAGIMGLVPMSFWYSSASQIEERWFFVRERYRRSRAAFRLRNFARTVAEDSNLPLFMAIQGQDDVERKAKLFRKMRLVGMQFMEG